jgi:hypothetical protein
MATIIAAAEKRNKTRTNDGPSASANRFVDRGTLSRRGRSVCAEAATLSGDRARGSAASIATGCSATERTTKVLSAAKVGSPASRLRTATGAEASGG